MRRDEKKNKANKLLLHIDIPILSCEKKKEKEKKEESDDETKRELLLPERINVDENLGHVKSSCTGMIINI